MIDFHSHILPNLDDGSRNYEETYNLIDEAREVGFTKIISTSHYMKNYYEVTKKQQEKCIQLLNKNSNGLEIIMGNEVFACEDMVNLIKNDTISTIGNSKYVLIEFPMNNKPFNLEDDIYRLQDAGFIPIVAHPERYTYVKENPNILIELIEMGALLQANYGSIIGIYGSTAQKTIKKLLQHNMIHFLGSDVHRENSIYPKIPQVLNELRKIISEEQIKRLTLENIEKMLKNKELEIEKPIKIKRNFWSNIFKK